MEKAKKSFPPGLDYATALDTTLPVTEGIKEIEHTLFEALVLVILVVYIFLQGWRATLIPVAGGAGFAGRHIYRFPVAGIFDQHTFVFGLVLAIGLGRGRRDRRCRSSRTSYRTRIITERSFSQGDGRSVRAR